MSEVNRYWVESRMLIQEGWHHDDTEVVQAWAFDRVTAERDALQDRLNESDELCSSLERSMKNHRHELGLVQQRLTAADERADVLEGLLREVQKSARKQDWASGYPTLFASVDAALKPAEGGGDD
ncbi:hypothetical protein [Pseudomonas phage HU1]|nr:hypothetical protein [Pseudomonas phage HU1]